MKISKKLPSILLAFLFCFTQIHLAFADEKTEFCEKLLIGAPQLTLKQTTSLKKYILTHKTIPGPETLISMGIEEFDSKFIFGGGLNQNHKNSIVFASEEQEPFQKEIYDELKSWVSRNKVFPPSFSEFRDFLGIAPEESNQFEKLFNRKTGLFRGYEEDFISKARIQPGLSDFLSQYQDRRTFNPDVADQITKTIKTESTFLVAGYINGMPLADGVMDATYALQKKLSRGATTPLFVFPAYGVSSGLPERFFEPNHKRFVIPKQLHLQGGSGNKVTINETPVGPRQLKPDTGIPRQMEPGKTMIGVHPQSTFTPFSSDSAFPSAYVTTGCLNARGFNIAKNPIGARISAIQNDSHHTGLLILEKVAGSPEELVYGLESRFRPRELSYNEKPVTIQLGNRTVTYPRGFSDLNKHYGEDGVVRDLLILNVTVADSHSPSYDPGYFTNLNRQFIDPTTGLKNVDGSPAPILSFTFNDHFNNDFGSRHTDADLEAQQSLVNDPLEYDLNLHLKHGLALTKDLQRAVRETRGYTPHVVFNYSNHDYDRFSAKIKSGDYAFDAKNANAYLLMKQYKNAGKNFFKEYLFRDVGVGYPDYVHVLGPKDRFAISDAIVSHGHTGGVYGKPVSAVNRRAAQGSAILGDSHVAMILNGVYNAGHATLPFEYARGFFNKGYKAVVIQTPLHVQLLLYENGSFYGAVTHGISELEFSPGYPFFKDLPLDVQTVPNEVHKIDQYWKKEN